MNENIFRKILNEAFYGKKDIDDYGFKYLRKVLNDFETEDTIFLKKDNNKRGIETNITQLKNKNNFKKNITRFQNWLNNTEDNKDDDRLSIKIGTSKDDYKSADNRESLLKAFKMFFVMKVRL